MNHWKANRPNKQRRPTYGIRGLANIYPKRPFNQTSTVMARTKCRCKTLTSISPPLLTPALHSLSPTNFSSPSIATQLPSNPLVRSCCTLGGMPVTDSSLAFSWPMLQDGEIRRSAERSGGALVEGPGTVIMRGMSGIVCRDILIALVSCVFC
jgi:hypothetical protein